VSDLVEVVSFDVSLTAALLRRANSAALGARVQIKTVRDAAMWMGSGSLLALALATTISRRLKQPIPAYGLAEGQLWKQSVAASLAAEVIRTRASVDVPAEAPTAALLHDFGKVVLAQHFGGRVLDLLVQAATADNLTLLEAESVVLGVNHADIGGLVAAQWKLPHTIVEGIIHHHQTRAHPSAVSAVVSLAHAMVPEVLAGVGSLGDTGTSPACAEDSDPTSTHVEVMAQLGLAPEGHAELLAAAQERYLELADRYDVR
jgi:HD-like signal output (HDOD) protein